MFIPLDSYEKFQQLTGGIESIITILALIIGGIWAYARFIRQEENHPQITFTADINFICKQGRFWVVELISTIENSGRVTHRFKEFEFEFCALNTDDSVDLSKDFNNQAFFPHRL